MQTTGADIHKLSRTTDGPDLGASCNDNTDPFVSGIPLLTIGEVAVRLGVQIRHIRRLVHEERIPYIKWGRLLRFDPADIERWIDGCRHSGSTSQP